VNEAELKLEMRLYAVELFVANIVALHCLNTKKPLESFEETKTKCCPVLGNRLFQMLVIRQRLIFIQQNSNTLLM
jgi:hypothetical protein